MKEATKITFIWSFALISAVLYVGLFILHFYFDKVASKQETQEKLLLDYDDGENETSYKYHGICMLTGITLLTLGVLIHFLLRSKKNRRNLHCIHIVMQVIGLVSICVGTWLTFMTDKIDPIGFDFAIGKVHSFCGFIMVLSLILQMVIGFIDFYVDIEKQWWVDYFPHVHGCTGSWIVINLFTCYFTGLGYRYYLKIGYEDPEYEETMEAMHFISIFMIIAFFPAIILYHYKEQMMSRRFADARGSLSQVARPSVARPSTF